MFRSTIAVFALAFAPSALATLFMTSPIASTTCTAGQQCTIAWKDDGNAPPLATFGASSVGVYAGSQQQQTLLQSINTNVDVTTTSTIIFTPSASIGPNSGDYFIKFVSLAGTVPGAAAGSNTPAEAFSAKFTLASMTGQFNASVQSQINGATGASASPSSTGTGNLVATTGSSATTTSKPTTGSSSSGSKTGTSSGTSTSSTATSGAERLVASAVGIMSVGTILFGLL